MDLKAKKLKIKHIITISIIAFAMALLMSLSAYATSPSADDVQQASQKQQASSLQTNNEQTDAAANKDDSAINVQKDNGQNTQTVLDDSASDAVVNEIENDINSHKIDLPQSLDTTGKNADQTVDEERILPEENLAIINANYPNSYDLRDVDGKNYVPPVKFQNPWGSCWAFSVVSAAEVSILTSLNKTYSETNLDLSEHHLTWFTRSHIPAKGEEGYSEEDTQAGEGTYCDNPMGGEKTLFATSTFSNGLGPVPESYAPYRGVLGRVVAKNNKEYDSEQAARDAGTEPFTYSANDDWSLPESKRYAQSFKLDNTYLLTNTMSDNDQSTDTKTTINTFKNEIQNGRAISISYAADGANVVPSYLPNWQPAKYMNMENWAQYTYDDGKAPSHGVTIVGWDDDFNKQNFQVKNPAEWDEHDHAYWKLKDEIVGKELLNKEDGTPYYNISLEIEGQTRTVPYTVDIEDIPYLLDKTDKTDENDHTIYKWKTKFDGQDDTQFENNPKDGSPYVPNGKKDKQLHEYYFVCQTVNSPDPSPLPEDNGAWICKNSWGSATNEFPNWNEWGDDGYFYLSYYDKSLKYAETLEFSEYNTDTDETYSLAYEYDYMPTMGTLGGKCCQDDYSEYSMGNQFGVEKDTTLDSVSCYTCFTGSNAKLDIYIQNENSTSPIDGTLVASKSETFLYPGYHKVTLDNEISIPAGKVFSVVCTETYLTKDKDTGQAKINYALPVSVGANEKYKEEKQKDSYSVAVVNPNESFVIYNKTNENKQTIVDWKDYILTDEFNNEIAKDVFDGDRSYFDVDNVAVKAYGHYASNPTPDPDPDPDNPSDNTDSNTSTTSYSNDDTTTENPSTTTSDFMMYAIIALVIIVACAGIAIYIAKRKHNKK